MISEPVLLALIGGGSSIIGAVFTLVINAVVNKDKTKAETNEIQERVEAQLWQRVKDELDAMGRRVDALEHENASLKSENETLKKNQERLERENRQLRQRIVALEKENGHLKKGRRL